MDSVFACGAISCDTKVWVAGGVTVSAKSQRAGALAPKKNW